MSNFWVFNKYCRLPNFSSYPSRSLSLLRCFIKQGHSALLVELNIDHKLSSLLSFPKFTYTTFDGISIVSVHTLYYRKAKSLHRVIGWLHFELCVFLLHFKSLPKPDVVITSSLSLLSVINGLLFKIRFHCLWVFEVRDVWPLLLVLNGGFSAWNPLIWILNLIEWIGYRFF